jgi:environmental stress-induced protein Ves
MTMLWAAARLPRWWTNGLGTTYEVMIWPPGSTVANCEWRVSIADMVAHSAFSALPGLDRTLVALAGEGIDLIVDGKSISLDPFEIAQFSGESVASGGPRGAATQDLNFMVRRHENSTRQERATLQVFRRPQQHRLQPETGHLFIAIVADGTAELNLSRRLQNMGTGDAVVLDHSQAAKLRSTSTLVLIDVVSDRGM